MNTKTVLLWIIFLLWHFESNSAILHCIF